MLPECLYGKYTPCEEVNPAPSAQAAAPITKSADMYMPCCCRMEVSKHSSSDEGCIELGCHILQTLFKHYTGSTWHGSDASTLKWVFRERLPLLAFVAAAAAALTAVAVSRGWLVAWAGGSGGSSSTLGSKAH